MGGFFCGLKGGENMTERKIGYQHPIPEKRVPLITDYTGPIGDERIAAIAASRKQKIALEQTQNGVVKRQHNYSQDGIELVLIADLKKA